jgi:hypothetical protein
MLVKSPNGIRALGYAGFNFLFWRYRSTLRQVCILLFLVHVHKQIMSYLCPMAEFQRHHKQTLIWTIWVIIYVKIKTTTKKNELHVRPMSGEVLPASRSMEDNVGLISMEGKDTWLSDVLSYLYCGTLHLKLDSMYGIFVLYMFFGK